MEDVFLRVNNSGKKISKGMQYTVSTPNFTEYSDCVKCTRDSTWKQAKKHFYNTHTVTDITTHTQ